MDIKNLVQFKELSDTSIYVDHPELTLEECSEEVHMISTDNNKIFRGGEVIAELIKELPGVSKLSWLIEKERSQKTIDFFYNSLNKVRRHVASDCPKCNKSKKTKL